jgi:hypothetical protein
LQLFGHEGLTQAESLPKKEKEKERMVHGQSIIYDMETTTHL